jgi:pSer/pThr/pTyr-binding forkhead associated (FHA) protein
MVYSVADRVSEPLREPDPRRGTARLRLAGRTELVGSGGATLGRSRECDVVVDDPNVSRQHAEIRPSGGSWIVRDLGSTNGIKVNGRRVQGPQSLRPGDVIELGTSRITFELE